MRIKRIGTVVFLVSVAALGVLLLSRGRLEPAVTATTPEANKLDHGKHPAMTNVATTPTDGDRPRVRRMKDLPIIADGAVKSDQISDDLAYRHVLTAMIGRDGTDAAKRRALILSRVGLSPDSTRIVAKILSDASDELASIDKALQAPSDNGPALRNRRREFLDGLQSTMRARLQPPAIAMLDSYVRNRVKRQIVVYRWPDQMKAGRSH